MAIPSQKSVPQVEPDWRTVGKLESLRATGRMLVRVDGKQIAVFATSNGLLACNNRCPHEGYPLVEGTLDAACTLTCNWHNWKFDLTTGANLYGGDRLRTYPAEVRGQDVWVDVADAPYQARYESVLAGLQDAFDDNAYDRIARELARLESIGADPLDAVRNAIHWSHDRMEFGWTHAFAAMADWLQPYDEHSGDAQVRLICLLESVAHAADDVLRERAYPFDESVVPYDEAAFLQAIEAEDEQRAVAAIRGGLDAGFTFADFEGGLTRAALAHYNDFGHSLIYVTKARRLIERLGDDVAAPLLLSLVREIVFATREDLIPEFRGYAEALAKWGEAPAAGQPRMVSWHKLGINAALALAVEFSGADLESLYAALLGANATNLLGFDIAHQEKVRVPVSANVGWLDFTHGITFASAVREQCTKFPDQWPRGLLQMACFAGRNAAFTACEPDLQTWKVEDKEAFFAKAVDGLFDHGLDEFIVSVHLLKTILGAREEFQHGVPQEVGEALVAGLNRFLGSPLRRKHVRRTVHQAMAFVAHE